MRTTGHLSAVILIAAMVLPTPVKADPTVTVYTDADTYRSGDTVEVGLSAQNQGPGAWVSVYVGLLTPEGCLYTLSAYGQNGWSDRVEAWIPEIKVPGS